MSIYDSTSLMVSEDNEYYWIEIPDHLIEKMGWWIDDKLMCEVVDNRLVIINVSKNERKEDNNE